MPVDIRRVFQTLVSPLAHVKLVYPTLFYSRVIVRGHQLMDRCVHISRVNSCRTSYMLCRAVEISVLLACFMTIK